eukprot:2368814-Prymnesium_polylepis.1
MRRCPGQNDQNRRLSVRTSVLIILTGTSSHSSLTPSRSVRDVVSSLTSSRSVRDVVSYVIP